MGNSANDNTHKVKCYKNYPRSDILGWSFDMSDGASITSQCQSIFWFVPTFQLVILVFMMKTSTTSWNVGTNQMKTSTTSWNVGTNQKIDLYCLIIEESSLITKTIIHGIWYKVFKFWCLVLIINLALMYVDTYIYTSFSFPVWTEMPWIGN